MVAVDNGGHVAVPLFNGQAVDATGSPQIVLTIPAAYNDCAAIPAEPNLTVRRLVNYTGELPTIDAKFYLVACNQADQEWSLGVQCGDYVGGLGVIPLRQTSYTYYLD